jgi:hypothetical protein
VAAAGFYVYPASDDAMMTLISAEGGPEELSRRFSSRMIMAALWNAVFTLEPATARVVGVILNTAFWVLLAMQARWLWRRLFPGQGGGETVAAVLSITPVFAMTQFITVSCTFPVNLPVSLSYGGVLLFLRWTVSGGGAAAFSGGCLLAALATILSEYGLAPSLAVAPLALAAGAPRRRAGIAGLAALLFALAGSAIFYFLADYSTRPDALPGEQIQLKSAEDLLVYLGSTTTALWRMVIGMPAAAFSAVRLSWGEKSTLASMALGIVLAALTALAGIDGSRDFSLGRFRGCLLLAACWIALLPELVRQGFWMIDHWMIPEPLSSRFHVSAIPIAAVLVTAALWSLFRVEHRIWVGASLGLVCGYALGLHPAATVRTQRLLPAAGRAVRPFVENSTGLTVLLLDHYYGREYELVYHATAGWPDALRKRLLISYDQRLSGLLDRPVTRSTACRNLNPMRSNQSGFIRSGPVSHFLFARLNPKAAISLESYCVPPEEP